LASDVNKAKAKALDGKAEAKTVPRLRPNITGWGNNYFLN